MVTLLGIYLNDNPFSDSGAPVPYVMPMVHARFYHRFTEWQKFPEISFVSSAELAPVWLSGNAELDAKVLPFLTFSVGGAIGTSWGMNLGFIDFEMNGKYNAEKSKYDEFTAFTHWQYSAFIGASLKYDFGALFSGGMQHLTFGADGKISYIGMTGVENGEIWKNLGTCGQVNGLKYDAALSVNYKISVTLPVTVGASAVFSGYFSDRFFDDKYKGYDGDFVTAGFAPTASASLTRKDMLNLIVPFSSRRRFDSSDTNLQPLMQAKGGRKWYWNGVILTYTHMF